MRALRRLLIASLLLALLLLRLGRALLLLLRPLLLLLHARRLLRPLLLLLHALRLLLRSLWLLLLLRSLRLLRPLLLLRSLRCALLPCRCSALLVGRLSLFPFLFAALMLCVCGHHCGAEHESGGRTGYSDESHGGFLNYCGDA